MLGSAVAAALHRSGARVTSLSRSPARAEVLRGVADHIVLGDATRPDTLRGAFDGVDSVISCLGAPMAFSGGDRRSFRELDTVANLNLIRAARAAGVRRFVYVSLLVRPAWSATVYARAHEEVVEELARSGLSYGVVRPTGMFPIFDPFLTMARRGIAWIPGDGQAQTNPVHPHEVAEACLEVLTSEDTDSTMVGGPEILTRQEIVETGLPRGGHPAPDPSSPAAGAARRVSASPPGPPPAQRGHRLRLPCADQRLPGPAGRPSSARRPLHRRRELSRSRRRRRSLRGRQLDDHQDSSPAESARPRPPPPHVQELR